MAFLKALRTLSETKCRRINGIIDKFCRENNITVRPTHTHFRADRLRRIVFIPDVIHYSQIATCLQEIGHVVAEQDPSNEMNREYQACSWAVENASKIGLPFDHHCWKQLLDSLDSYAQRHAPPRSHPAWKLLARARSAMSREGSKSKLTLHGSSANDVTKAMQRIKALFGETVALEFENWLLRVPKWTNATALFHSLAVAADKEALLDHLATLRYGLIFGYLGFAVSFEPTGTQGPDLLITRDRISATVEVTRFRSMNPGPSVLSEEKLQSDELILEPYGNPCRDVPKSLRKIKEKFRQALAPHAIIAVWNDDEALEELEMSIALRNLRQNSALPAGLEFVIYRSRWISYIQLHIFPMKPQLDPVIQQWAQQIKSVNLRVAIQNYIQNNKEN
jgi:hypothetical protein